MQVVLASMFRNSSRYLDRYGAQCAALRDALQERGDTLRLIVAEGDSTDDTPVMLPKVLQEHHGLTATILKVDHGGPEYGSVNSPERWAQIALVCNVILEKFAKARPKPEAFIWVESDLIWDAPTMLALLGHLIATDPHPDGSVKPGVDVACPLCYAKSKENGIVYDIWGMRKDGVWFNSSRPYHQALVGWQGGLVELDSSGSCLVMRGEVAAQCRFAPEDAIVGWCRDMRAKGFRLWLDPALYVVHP